MKPELSYISEDDKCYGATGMAIGIVVYDSEQMLASINLDNSPSEMMEFIDEFYFSGNPSLSAKSAWKQILNSYNLTSAMAIANVMCRYMVLNHKLLDASIKKVLKEKILDEGSSACSLEPDESDRLFEKNYNFLYRVFNHRGVQDIANDFAGRLKRVRRMSRFDIIEQLRGLQSL